MTIAESLSQQMVYEGASTRKLLERLSDARMDWRPHAKSFTLGDLASHVADSWSWAKPIVELDSLDIASGEHAPTWLSVASEILALYDRSIAVGIEALNGVSDDRMLQNWQLKSGDTVLFDLPRVAVVQTMVISHIIHHRGQLTVYMRMNDIPLPGIYGPSADEA